MAKAKKAKQNPNKKKIIIRITALLLIVIGASIWLYPSVDNHIYKSEQKKVIENFEKKIEDNKKPKKNKQNDEQHIDLDGLRKAVKAYNRSLIKYGQTNLNADTCQRSAIDLPKYGLTDNIYGYISIPSLDINMAIYLGASEYNMACGAAHLNMTSIPYGQKSSNAVLAGHCGYWGKQMFQYISSLQSGDVIYIRTPFEMLTYQVTEKKVIDPTDYQSICIKEKRDMLTLFTCYPYPTNKQRICVYCERA